MLEDQAFKKIRTSDTAINCVLYLGLLYFSAVCRIGDFNAPVMKTVNVSKKNRKAPYYISVNMVPYVLRCNLTYL